ncbi:MAG TPA: hypothetical protein VEX43_05770 [Chthoniobacterales bacterium]|nr:hypothetical protein [Chthoniobacterales bacterium]
MTKFIRSCGFALCFGGALTILINVVISPFMPANQDGAVVMLTDVYLLRQSASGVAALLLLAGSIGLHLAQRPASGWLGTIAFLFSFVGGCALFAVEFVDVFVLRAVAQIAPETVGPLDKSPLMNVGFASAASLFALGWILLSITVWKTKILPRRAAQATLAGLFLIPILQGTLGLVGAIVANLVFGGGLIGLGWALTKTPTREESL